MHGYVYCLDCESYERLTVFGDAKYHISDCFTFCYGPFVTCAPPEMTEEMWEVVFANEPSDEELKQMEQECEL